MISDLTLPPPPSGMTFYGPDQDVVGTLTWDGGKLQFSGEADQCAKALLQFLAQHAGLTYTPQP